MSKKLDMVPLVENKEAFIRHATTFCNDYGILGPPQLNDLVAFAYLSSRHVRDVEVFIDSNKNAVLVQVFLSRWGYLITNKKNIIQHLVQYVKPILGTNYTLDVEVKLARKNGRSTENPSAEQVGTEASARPDKR